jgi:hypothetical protein
MPTTRQCFVPHVIDRSDAELRAYIEGEDPINHRPFLQEILEGLTRPLDPTDAGLTFHHELPRLLDPAPAEELQERFRSEGWTDFLPIVLPTEERVERMLRGTHRAPDEVVGRLAPAQFRPPWEFTVEKIAVNAVMAGAAPEHLPVILAVMSSGLSARLSGTTSMGAMVLVNGPIARELGINAGIGAMGPYSHASAAIGRAFSLASQNLQGGSVPEETYMGSQGNVYSYSLCFAENEERSPWEPFHVEHGFDPQAGVVTTILGAWYTLFGSGVRDTWERTFTRAIHGCDVSQPPLVVLDPLAAQSLVRRGIESKADFKEWLSEASRLPAGEYWDNLVTQTKHRPHAVAGIEPFASRLRAADDELVRAYEPSEIEVIVVGGETAPTWRMIGLFNSKMVPVDDWR